MPAGQRSLQKGPTGWAKYREHEQGILPAGFMDKTRFMELALLAERCD